MKDFYKRPLPSEIGQATRESEQTIPVLTILTGPSGVGKSLLLTELISRHPDELVGLPSVTDRWRDGIDRKLSISPALFTQMEEKNEFYFVLEKYGYRYGTPRKLVDEALKSGGKIVMDFPLAELSLLQNKLGVPSQVIFILPPNIKEQMYRLLPRPERRANAMQDIHELGHLAIRRKVDFFLVNRNLERSVIELERLVLKK